MKKFLSIMISCFILIFSFGCNGAPQREEVFGIPYGGMYKDHYSSEDFALGLRENLTNEDKDFYVLAPQDYCTDEPIKGYNCMATIKEDLTYSVTSGESYTALRVMCQTIYVCNEQKYGKQVIDWGQVGGLALNFKIQIVTDVNYEKEVDELVFDYGLENAEDGEFWCDLYNGEDCFATVYWLGYGYATKEKAKNCLETYVNENLMKKSEYLQRNENGEFTPSTCVVEEMTSPLWRGYYFDIGVWGDIYSETLYNNVYMGEKNVSQEDIFELEKESSKYSNVYFRMGVKENVYPRVLESTVVAKSKDQDGNLVEPVLSLYYCHYDYSFGGSPNCGQNGNFNVYAFVVSINAQTLDTSLISIEWIDSFVANVYYDGFCFATIDFFFSTFGGSKITENSDEFLKNYCEDFIKTNLKLIA